MSRQFETNPICHDNRKCFGQMFKRGGSIECRILQETYENDGECPFCKEDEADIPNSDMRNFIHDKGVKYTQVAMHLGISERRLSDLMGFPLSEKNRKRIKKAVMEIVEGRDVLKCTNS